ncbi:uncharacterized protein LOC123933218 [Meles meles]|uniref:uncharacterized protein LOC123933218 n=1 Tax=Meles meles TaxID=9662 RepID=UPI001E6A002B|nr:uncharacterized protein LOC123933218 [Meles meles]
MRAPRLCGDGKKRKWPLEILCWFCLQHFWTDEMQVRRPALGLPFMDGRPPWSKYRQVRGPGARSSDQGGRKRAAWRTQGKTSHRRAAVVKVGRISISLCSWNEPAKRGMGWAVTAAGAVSSKGLDASRSPKPRPGPPWLPMGKPRSKVSAGHPAPVLLSSWGLDLGVDSGGALHRPRWTSTSFTRKRCLKRAGSPLCPGALRLTFLEETMWLRERVLNVCQWLLGRRMTATETATRNCEPEEAVYTVCWVLGEMLHGALFSARRGGNKEHKPAHTGRNS